MDKEFIENQKAMIRRQIEHMETGINIAKATKEADFIEYFKFKIEQYKEEIKYLKSVKE